MIWEPSRWKPVTFVSSFLRFACCRRNSAVGHAGNAVASKVTTSCSVFCRYYPVRTPQPVCTDSVPPLNRRVTGLSGTVSG